MVSTASPLLQSPPLDAANNLDDPPRKRKISSGLSFLGLNQLATKSSPAPAQKSTSPTRQMSVKAFHRPFRPIQPQDNVRQGRKTRKDTPEKQQEQVQHDRDEALSLLSGGPRSNSNSHYVSALASLDLQHDSVSPQSRKVSGPTGRRTRIQSAAPTYGGKSTPSPIDDLYATLQFLVDELGATALQRRSAALPVDLWLHEEGDEEYRKLWSSLYDGVLLCRLANQIIPESVYYIDRRETEAASIENVHSFLAVLRERLFMQPHEIFEPADLLEGSAAGIRAVVRTLVSLSSIAQNARALRYQQKNNSESEIMASLPQPKASAPIPIPSRRNSQSFTHTNLSRSLEATSTPYEPPPFRPSSPSPPRSLALPVTPKRRASNESERPMRTFGSGSSDGRGERRPVAPTFLYSDRRMNDSAAAVDVMQMVNESEESLTSRQHSPSPVKPEGASPSFKVLQEGASPLFYRPKVRPASPRKLSGGLPPNISPLSIPQRSLSVDAPKNRNLSPRTTARSPLSAQMNAAYKPVPVSGSPRLPFPMQRAHSDVPTGSTPDLPTMLNRPQHSRWNSELYLDSSARRSREETPSSARRYRHESAIPTPTRGEHEDSPVSRRRSVDKSPGMVRQRIAVKVSNGDELVFQIGDPIGKGQFGTVYKAVNLESGRVVAIKRIRLSDKTDEEIELLSREVDLNQRLSHPAVIKYEGVSKTSNFLNIVLEFAEGLSLRDHLNNYGIMDEAQAAGYTLKILEGLAYLHSMHVTHCDLKAANLLTTKNGNVKVSDFGVSLLTSAGESESVQGSPNWMAPEVIELKGATPKSDIWALGCTIIELLTGRPPYGDLIALSAMYRIVKDPCPPMPPFASPELLKFLGLCFIKDRDARPNAVDLFEHPWIVQNQQYNKINRPQDSIPFMRRISHEYRKIDLKSFAPPILERTDSLEVQSPTAMTEASPNSLNAGTSNSLQMTRERSASPPNVLSMSIPSISPLPESLESVNTQNHSFVKSSFGKAVECKLCRQSVKRGAVFCQDCGLVCHSKCIEYAPTTCDLRAQLLQYGLSSPIPIPTSPTVSGLPSPSQFFMGNRFGKSKRKSKTSGSAVDSKGSASSAEQFSPRPSMDIARISGTRRSDSPARSGEKEKERKKRHSAAPAVAPYSSRQSSSVGESSGQSESTSSNAGHKASPPRQGTNDRDTPVLPSPSPSSSNSHHRNNSTTPKAEHARFDDPHHKPDKRNRRQSECTIQ